MNDYLNDAAKALRNLIERCEGAMMAAKGGDYLHNFAFMVQEELKQVLDDVETQL